MALAAAEVGGGAASWKQAAAPGTNSSARCTSASHTFSTGDLILGIWHSQENSVNDWTISTTVVTSGGSVGTATVYGPSGFSEGGGYKAHAKFIVCQVTSGWTGTVSFDRTPTGTADHWTACRFVVITGHDTTTPVIEAISVNEANGGDGVAAFPNWSSTPPSTAYCFYGGSAGQSGTNWTAPSGFTEDLDQDTYGPATSGHKYGSVGNLGNITVSSVSSYGYQASAILIAEASSGTTTTPSVVAAVGAVPSPTKAVSTLPAVVPAVVAMPTLVLAIVKPGTVVAAVTVVQSPSASASAVLTPTRVAGVTAIPSPTITASGTRAATTVAAVAAVPSPSIATGVISTPTTVAAVAAVPTPAESASAEVLVDTLGLLNINIYDYTWDIGFGSAKQVTTVVAVASIPSPTVAIGTSVTPAVVAAVVSIPAQGVGIVDPQVNVTATVAIPSPILGLLPNTVPAIVAIPVNFNISVPAATTQVPSYHKRRRSPRIRKPSVVGGNI